MKNKPLKGFFSKFFKISITQSEVLTIINKLKDETAAGVGGVSVKILKLIAPRILEPLYYNYNLGITNGIFPENWKSAIIKLLYKNGDKTCINNYRPISMLSNFSKISRKLLILYFRKV